MGLEYTTVLRTPAGVKVAEFTDYRYLNYSKQVNAPGFLTFSLKGTDRRIPLFETNGQVEVWRSWPEQGIPRYCDFYGLFRGRAEETLDTGLDTFTARCPGQMSILGRRIVSWFAGTGARSLFTLQPAETIMKLLVEYNATISATTGAGRVGKDGFFLDRTITIQADSMAGAYVEKACAWKNLLTALQELAQVALGDFDLIKTGDSTWDFRFYPGQRGTDRTTGDSKVTLALEFGNMSDPRYTSDAVDEKTIAIVGGQGEGSARATQIVYGSGTDNDIEVFVDARNETTADGLTTAGVRALRENAAQTDMTFTVLQTPACKYGRDYDLGDLVISRYRTHNMTQKIRGVDVSVSPESKNIESIRVEMEDVAVGG